MQDPLIREEVNALLQKLRWTDEKLNDAWLDGGPEGVQTWLAEFSELVDETIEHYDNGNLSEEDVELAFGAAIACVERNILVDDIAVEVMRLKAGLHIVDE